MADPLTSAIASSVVSSVVSSVLEAAMAPGLPPPQPPGMGVIRTLPEEAKTGTMQKFDFGFVQIDKQMYPLSPGAQVRDEMNMIVMPGAARGPAKVRYLLDFTGAVHRIWVLSSAEVSLPAKP